MAQNKAPLVAALVALAIVGAPLAASAAPHVSPKNISGISFHAEDDEYEEDDGDDDHDDNHKSIPPVFVVPGATKPHHSRKIPPSTQTSTSGTTATIKPATTDPVTGASIDPTTGNEFVVIGAGEDPATNSLGGVNPEEARAIDIKRVALGRKSPADEFMDTAYLGMGMLGVSALGLGVTAAVRAIRVRRGGKSDYLYGDK